MNHYAFTGDRKDDLSSPILPLVLIFLLSWTIASMFTHIYSVSLECMFICYLADKNGDYTPGKIKKTFEKVEARELAKQQAIDKRRDDDRKERLTDHQSAQMGSYGAATTTQSNNMNPYAR